MRHRRENDAKRKGCSPLKMLALLKIYFYINLAARIPCALQLEHQRQGSSKFDWENKVVPMEMRSHFTNGVVNAAS